MRSYMPHTICLYIPWNHSNVECEDTWCPISPANRGEARSAVFSFFCTPGNHVRIDVGRFWGGCPVKFWVVVSGFCCFQSLHGMIDSTLINMFQVSWHNQHKIGSFCWRRFLHGYHQVSAHSVHRHDSSVDADVHKQLLGGSMFTITQSRLIEQQEWYFIIIITKNHHCSRLYIHHIFVLSIHHSPHHSLLEVWRNNVNLLCRLHLEAPRPLSGKPGKF